MNKKIIAKKDQQTISPKELPESLDWKLQKQENEYYKIFGPLGKIRHPDGSWSGSW